MSFDVGWSRIANVVHHRVRRAAVSRKLLLCIQGIALSVRASHGMAPAPSNVADAESNHREQRATKQSIWWRANLRKQGPVRNTKKKRCSGKAG